MPHPKSAKEVGLLGSAFKLNIKACISITGGPNGKGKDVETWETWQRENKLG